VLQTIMVFSVAIAFLLVGIAYEWADLLVKVGIPVRELFNPWLRTELVTFRVECIMISTGLIISSIILWRCPHRVKAFAEKIDAIALEASTARLFIPLSLTTLILMKTVLQLGLYLIGYSAYGADDFSRSLKADYWLHYRRFDLGWEGWLGLGGNGWLPFPDYLFSLGLALHRDLYLTPKIVNLVISAIAVIAVYLLGRELFGRSVGLLTAALFAFQPWHLWLGISGMTSDLPSVVLITLFGVFLVRWLQTETARDLLAAAGFLGVANGFRYENWLFSAVFSLFVVFIAVSRWKRGRLTQQWITLVICALTMINAFPVVWMIASYVVLGDWLPAFHITNAWMVSGMAFPTSNIAPDIPLAVNNAPHMAQVNMLVLALGSFPLELALSIAGVALLLTSDRRKPFPQYLVVLVATSIVFAVVFKGRLSASVFFARFFLPFVVFALPFGAYFLLRLFRTPRPWQNEAVIATCIIVLAMAGLDFGRALNYPAMFPADAISAGWTIRRLQETGTISDTGKILIERTTDWGDLGIVAIANRPERFVAINQRVYEQLWVQSLPFRRRNGSALIASADDDVRGRICDAGFHLELCKNSVLREKFNVVILSTPGRVSSFQQTFPARSWIIGRYHIFDMKSLPPSAHATRG
jgi:uncharacterized membrane protein